MPVIRVAVALVIALALASLAVACRRIVELTPTSSVDAHLSQDAIKPDTAPGVDHDAAIDDAGIDHDGGIDLDAGIPPDG